MSIFTRTYALPSGLRVRIRLARAADADAVAALLARRGVTAGPLELRRLLTFDPVRRAVALAFAPMDGHETLVGVGGIDFEPIPEPDTLVVDEQRAPGLGRLLAGLLVQRAADRAERVA